MIIEVSIQPSTLRLSECATSVCGALVRFEGRVRPKEHGQTIEALVYEAYEPMAQEQMRMILEELSAVWSCQSARVAHRVGLIPVGDVAIVVEVLAIHRLEAFALTSAFMDRLKQDVPIWKVDSVVKTR